MTQIPSGEDETHRRAHWAKALNALRFPAMLAAVAAAYALLGKLGQTPAIPPGYASPVWPAAGMALAALLLLGNRSAFGVFAGSFTLTLYNSLSIHNTPFHSAVALSVCLALAAAFQAVFGAFLVRRFCGYPNPLHDNKQLWRLLFLGGPVSCLPASTLSVLILWLAGAIPASHIIFGWWNWWVGETMGVMVFTPLILIWSSSRKLPRWRRGLTVTLPLVLVFSLCIVLFNHVGKLQPHFLVFQPVYPKGIDLSDKDERRTHLEGFVVGVFRIGDMIEAVRRNALGVDIEMRLYGGSELSDDCGPSDERLLYDSWWFDPGREGKARGRPGDGESRRVCDHFTVEGRQGCLEYRPSESFLEGHRSLQGWYVLAGGVLFTGLLETFLLLMKGRTAGMEEVVQERTAQLHSANEELHRHIAERERSDWVIHEQYEMQRALFHNIPGFVFFKSKDHVYITANQGFCQLTGTSVAEIEGKTDHDLFPPDLAEKFQADDREVLTSGVPKLLIEERVEGPGDNRLWVSTSKSPFFNTSGEVIGLVGVAIDITDRKVTEEMLEMAYINLDNLVQERTAELTRANVSLKTTETRQKAILNNIPDIAWLKDCDCRFIAVNQPFIDVCGVPMEEVLGRSDFDIWKPELAALYRQDDLEVMESRCLKRVEEPLLDNEGRESWIETIKTPILNEQGDVIGTTGISRDITQRKKAEAMQNELYQEVARLVAERTAELAHANAALQKAHDLLEERVRERTRELEETHRELISKAMEAGRAQISAMILHNIGNAVTPIRVHLDSMAIQRLHSIADYMAHCLAEIKEHRDTLQHYLNEDPRGEKVLTFMSSLTRSLLESIDPMNDATRKIGSAIDYIADILTIQQGYAVREHESRETTDVNALIRNALRMQTSALQKRGIEAILDLDPQLPKVLIDKGRLMQVLVNLVVNAYEAIDEMDTTDPRREIVMRTRHRDGQILIHIADSGIGVAPEDLGAVFDLGKSHKGSSGFGLYYCEKFISASGGTITIESAGRRAGATVSISLPAGDVSVRQITTTKTSQRI